MNERPIETIILYDIRRQEKIEIDARKMAGKKFEHAFNEFEQMYGVEIILKRVCNREHFTYAYYGAHGFEVIKTFDGGRHIPEKVTKYLKDIYQFDKEMLTKTGAPDFIIYKLYSNGDVDNAFFVETKSLEDGLRYTQLDWVMTTKVPVYCFCIK